MLAGIDGEAETSKGRMRLFDHAAHQGIQTRPEEKINLFVSLSVDKNASLFLGPRSGIDSTVRHSVLRVWGSVTHSW